MSHAQYEQFDFHQLISTTEHQKLILNINKRETAESRTSPDIIIHDTLRAIQSKFEVQGD